MTPLAMAELSTFRQSLQASVSRVIVASPADFTQDAPHRDSPADTQKSRSKWRALLHLIPLPSLSSTSSSPALATTDDDEDRVKTKACYKMFAVIKCPDNRFASVLE